MPRPLVSVCMSTYQRAHLLRRSLAGYARSDGLDARADLELVVIDDGSFDDTREVVESWSRRTGIASVVLTPHPKPDGWRDCGANLNYGIRASSGRHVLLTHPEVIPGRKSVAACVKQLIYFDNKYESVPDVSYYLDRAVPVPPLGLYACCPVYYLSPRHQERIDTVPWRAEGNLALRQIPGFYDEDDNGNPDYTHRATDVVAQPGSRLPTWESWVFGGCSRRTWKQLGGMLTTQRWGSVDVAFVVRRQALGVTNHTTPDPETIVVHQNHDSPNDVKTPRDMGAWVEELKSVPLKDPRKMCHPEVDELGW